MCGRAEISRPRAMSPGCAINALRLRLLERGFLSREYAFCAGVLFGAQHVVRALKGVALGGWKLG